MTKEVKLVHFTIVDGTEAQIKSLCTALATIKKKLDFELEFLVTNDKIELSSVSTFIKQLIELYNREEKKLTTLKESIKNGKNK